MAQCLSDLGVAAHIRGEPGAARSLLDEALESARLAGDQRQTAMALNGLGRLALQDDPPRAAAYFEEGLACIRQAGDLRRTTIILGNLAVAVRNQGRTRSWPGPGWKSSWPAHGNSATASSPAGR